MNTSAFSLAVLCSRVNIEIWADIPGHPFYQASNLGKVRSLDRRIPHIAFGKNLTQFRKGRILKPGKLPKGYDFVQLGRKFPITVHRLVLAAFTGIWTTRDHQTRHLNGIPDDNRLFNLLPGTPKQNGEDSVRHNTSPKGERHPHSKLTEEDVLDIRWLVANGSISRRGVAAIYGVNPSNIDLIILRKTWAHV